MTTKVLLTIPFRLIPGLIMLLCCGIILAIGVTIKMICSPTQPIFDYELSYYYYTANVEWLHTVQWWWKWIKYGSTY